MSVLRQCFLRSKIGQKIVKIKYISYAFIYQGFIPGAIGYLSSYCHSGTKTALLVMYRIACRNWFRCKYLQLYFERWCNMLSEKIICDYCGENEVNLANNSLLHESRQYYCVKCYENHSQACLYCGSQFESYKVTCPACSHS